MNDSPGPGLVADRDLLKQARDLEEKKPVESQQEKQARMDRLHDERAMILQHIASAADDGEDPFGYSRRNKQVRLDRIAAIDKEIASFAAAPAPEEPGTRISARVSAPPAVGIGQAIGVICTITNAGDADLHLQEIAVICGGSSVTPAPARFDAPLQKPPVIAAGTEFQRSYAISFLQPGVYQPSALITFVDGMTVVAEPCKVVVAAPGN